MLLYVYGIRKDKEKQMIYYTDFNTTLCTMIIVGNEEGINHLHLNINNSNRFFKISPEWTYCSSFFEKEILQIKEYLQGKRSTFDIILNPNGTVFQKKVWNALSTIPIGQTVTYKDMAILIGNENASRAVGNANSKNPIPIIIPCHRVIGSNKKLTGYAFRIELKQKLINLEQKYNTMEVNNSFNLE
jgi:methylated-DNA-[protein]-cysteine S-methyltransferase